jgi:rhodanese-related sulfurtransferase
MTYAILTATLFKPDTKFVFVTSPGKERESIIRLARVGLDNSLGYLEGGFDSWANAGEEVFSYEFIDLINEDTDKFTIIDVREKKEWDKTGVLPGSHCISLSCLENKLEDIPKTLEIVIICNSAQRAATSISILKNNGFKNTFINVKGGVSYLLANQFDKLKIA